MRLFRRGFAAEWPYHHNVIAIGNFDGMHRGHQRLIQTAKTIEGYSVGILTFDPQPQQVLRPQALKDFRLTPFREKYCHARDRGLDFMISQPFDGAYSQKTAQEFVDQILYQTLRASHVVVGENFAFGYNRQGNVKFLRDHLKRWGIGLTLVPSEVDDGHIISSTLIRKALKDGRIDWANRLLGRPWQIVGRVITGQKQARKLGYPTANLGVDDQLLCPRPGVYQTQAGILNSKTGEMDWLPAITNMGHKPTFGSFSYTIETHILGYEGNLYGQRLWLRVLNWIRDEKRFDTVQNLINQIEFDIYTAWPKACVKNMYE